MTTAHQRRAFPWYKETPATYLADRMYKALSWAEKGLLTALRWEYWVNGALSATDELDAILGAEKGMCERLIGKMTGHFIEEIDGAFHFPDLKRQREKQVVTSGGRSAGGQKGGRASAARRAAGRATAANDEAEAQAYAQATYSPSRSPSNSTSGLQEVDDGYIDDEFTNAYSREEKSFPIGATARRVA